MNGTGCLNSAATVAPELDRIALCQTVPVESEPGGASSSSFSFSGLPVNGGGGCSLTLVPWPLVAFWL